jgi:hypothetical protein
MKNHIEPVARVLLIVRRTLDWRDERVFLAQLAPSFATKVEVWNATFRTPYHLFRHAIKEIAMRNHNAIEGITQAQWSEIPDGALVLPTDDDDWFAPDVVSCISKCTTGREHGIHWTQSVLEVPINWMHGVNLLARRVCPLLRAKFLCATNNYGVRKDGAADDVLNHMPASRRFGSGTMQLTFIPRRLSLHNRTLASITSMGHGKPTVSASMLRRKADRYRRLYERPNLPRGLEWAAGAIREMREIMADLRLR